MQPEQPVVHVHEGVDALVDRHDTVVRDGLVAVAERLRDALQVDSLQPPLARLVGSYGDLGDADAPPQLGLREATRLAQFRSADPFLHLFQAQWRDALCS